MILITIQGVSCHSNCTSHLIEISLSPELVPCQWRHGYVGFHCKTNTAYCFNTHSHTTQTTRQYECTHNWLVRWLYTHSLSGENTNNAECTLASSLVYKTLHYILVDHVTLSDHESVYTGIAAFSVWSLANRQGDCKNLLAFLWHSRAPNFH